MNPITKTAFYCAGLRMLDAEGPEPICGDDYAKCFSDNSSLELFDRLEAFERHKIANLFRHKIIDDVIDNRLSRDPDTRIILIGAGLDTRAFRLTGGMWFEIDEPEIMDYKNTRLPVAGCNNPLVRIPHSFSREALDEALRSCEGSSDALLVIEGVLRYLEESEVHALLLALRQTFSAHGLLCDLMSRRFYEQYGGATSGVLRELGAPVRFHAEDPQRFFEDMGYRLVDRISVIRTALESGHFVAESDAVDDKGTLFDGYSICRFALP